MSFDVVDLIRQRQGENLELHSNHVNPQFARVLKTIGFDRVYVRAEGAGVLLLAAATAGVTVLAVELVRRGVHIACVDDQLNTPLHLACEARHEATA